MGTDPEEATGIIKNLKELCKTYERRIEALQSENDSMCVILRAHGLIEDPGIPLIEVV